MRPVTVSEFVETVSELPVPMLKPAGPHWTAKLLAPLCQLRVAATSVIPVAPSCKGSGQAGCASMVT